MIFVLNVVKDNDMQRQDIKTMIDILTHLEVYPTDEYIVDSAITMLEELGNLVHKLKLENARLKKELKDINAAIDDPAVDLIITASEAILNMKKELDSTR